jgi:hypothetical protein
MAVQIRLQSPDVHIIFHGVCYRDPVDAPQHAHAVHGLDDDIDTLLQFLGTQRAFGAGTNPRIGSGMESCGATPRRPAAVLWDEQQQRPGEAPCATDPGTGGAENCALVPGYHRRHAPFIQ